MADATDPPGPGDGHTDPNTLVPRQEGGGLPSRLEEGSLDQDRHEEKVEIVTYFSPRGPSPGEDSFKEELGRHRYGRHRSHRGRHHRRSFSPVGKGAAGEVSFPRHMVSNSPQQKYVIRRPSIMSLVTPGRDFSDAVTKASYCDMTLRMLFLSFSFPENLEIAPKSDIVILAFT